MGTKALLTVLFANYGSLVEKQPWLFLIIPSFCAILLGSGLRLEKSCKKSGEELFFPANSPCLYELDVLNEQFPIESSSFIPAQLNNLNAYVTVFYLRKDGASMLNLTNINEIKALHQEVKKIPGKGVGLIGQKTEYSFDKDLCLKFLRRCTDSMQHINLLKFMLENEDKEDYVVRFYYPTVTNLKSNVDIFMGQVLGGVDMDPETNLMTFVRSVSVIYYLRNEPQNVDEASFGWSKEVIRKLPEIVEQFAPDLSVLVSNNHSAQDGMLATEQRVRRSFLFAYVALCLFAILISSRFTDRKTTTSSMSACQRWKLDTKSSKYGITVLGVFSTQLGIVSAYGILLYTFGVFHTMVTFSIFLVTAVGIDDTFITLNAWHRTGCLRETLEEAGMAISITTLTSVVSFLVSTLTKIEALQLYCLYAAMGLTFTYIYQMTILPAALQLTSKCFTVRYWEAKTGRMISVQSSIRNIYATTNGHKSINSPPLGFDASYNVPNGLNNLHNTSNGTNITSPQQKSILAQDRHVNHLGRLIQNGISSAFPNHNSGQHGNHENDIGFAANFVKSYYGPFLFQPKVKMAVILVIVLYIVVSLVGIFTQKIGLEGAALVPKDHHYNDFYYVYRDLYLVKGTPVDIIVNNPPDLSSPDEREKLNLMVEIFENCSYIWNPNATRYFLRDYEQFTGSNSLGTGHKSYNQQIMNWLSIGQVMGRFFKDIRFLKTDCRSNVFLPNACPITILAFRFRIMLRDIHRFEDRIDAANQIRHVAAQFPEYNVTTYHKQWRLVDQQAAVVPGATLTIFITVICMALISLFAFENLLSVVIITLSIISIDLGLIGICGLAGINLDSISMVLFTISIGFSVDYCAHVVYGYCRVGGSSNARALDSLVVMCIPVTQGALSTVIGMLVLVFVKSYVVRVFYVIIFGVAVFGLLHACVFLPVLLSLEDDLRKLCCGKSRPIYC